MAELASAFIVYKKNNLRLAARVISGATSDKVSEPTTSNYWSWLY